MAKNTNTAAPTTAAPKDTVKVKIPLTKTERDDVFVGLNGKTYLIKRGVEVEVPKGVAEILAHKEKMLETSMKFEAELAANSEKDK